MATLKTLLWLFCALGAQLPPAHEWATADVATRRLSPDDFRELPQLVRAELRRRGCTVPQMYAAGRRHNVIRSQFNDGAEADWAVLCSRQRQSSILVFWEGGPADIDEIAHGPDLQFLQIVAPGQIRFSREISVATADYILERHKRYGGPKPPALTHAGINDVFVDKASLVWYWHRGKWLHLTGAD